MPTRVINSSKTSNTGKISSSKNNLFRMYESSLEKDLMYILEFDCNVKDFEEQPVTIEYQSPEGLIRKYTPDFLVRYRNHSLKSAAMKPTLIEVKYQEDLKRNFQFLKPKFDAAVDYAEKNDMVFKVLTEAEIRTEYQLNAKFLVKYISAHVDLDKLDHLLNMMNDYQRSTPEEIILASAASRNMQGYYLYTLWHLIANGFIKCDLNRRLTMKSVIWANDGLNPKLR